MSRTACGCGSASAATGGWWCSCTATAHPTTWYRAAPLLAAAGFRVVCPDVRGYGRSTAPAPRADHSQASKRAMAGDISRLMTVLGHDLFAVAGHDRGSYVAHRLAMDHPDRVTHLAVLDSVPIGEARSL